MVCNQTKEQLFLWNNHFIPGAYSTNQTCPKGNIHLQANCDSVSAENPNDRRSTTTGYGIFLGSCLISWCGKKQPIVARSSTKAECQARSLATAELYWLQMLLQDLQVLVPLRAPPTLWCNNIGALAMASNPTFHARTVEVNINNCNE